MRIVTFFLAVLLLLTINATFIGIHYGADRAVPVETVKQRIRAAVASDNIIPEEFPWTVTGFASPLNTIGMHLGADCQINLMALHRNTNPVLNAVSPAYYRTALDNQLCDVVKALAEGKVKEAQLQPRSSYFFWYGAKPVTLLLLTRFDYFQIYQLIRQFSYFFIALLLAVAFTRSIAAGLAFLPISGLAILGSGLPYNGGIAFALPYLSALILASGFYLIQSRQTVRVAREVFYLVFAGAAQAFFYLLDGSMALLSALLMFGVYFMDRAGRPAGQRLKRMLGLMLVTYLGFIATLLLKQGFAGAFIGFDTVWTALQVKMTSLSGLGSDGADRVILSGLIHFYFFSILGHAGLAHYVQVIGMVSWALAAGLVLLFSLMRKTCQPFTDFLAFGLIALMVLARYLILPGNTPEDVIITGRYWFLPIAFGMSALLWLVSQYRYRESDSENNASDTLTRESETEKFHEPVGPPIKAAADEPEKIPQPGSEREPAVDNEQPAREPEPAIEDGVPDSKSTLAPKTEDESRDSKTETTKEPSRLTVEVPRFLDGR